LVWSEDGRYVAAGELDRAFWVWDLRQHKQRTTFYGKMAPVRALAFSPDSITLDTTPDDGGLQVWEMSTGQCIRTWQGFARTVHDIAWSPSGEQIASGGNDKLVTVWDVAERVPIQNLRGHTMMIWGVSWSPDGKLIASCSEDGTICIWDAAKGVSAGVLMSPGLTNNLLFSTAWSPDGKRLAVGSFHQGVLVYDAGTQTFQRVEQSDVPARIRRVEWSPGGKYLASASEGGPIRIWSGEDYSVRATLEGHRGMISCFAWTADGTRFASGSWGHGIDQLFIWDAQRWNRLMMLDDPNAGVYGVAWSADGRILVSAGSDGMLRWWDPQNGQCIRSQPGHQGVVQSLRASADRRQLASCGDDGAIRIWRLESGEQVTTLRRDCPYERLDITGIKGLTDGQKQTLKMMGAVEQTGYQEEDV
jgi:WD40 repeat protein